MVRAWLATAVLLGAASLSPVVSHGEIVKFGQQTDKGLQLYWWPRLPPSKGWASDGKASRLYGCNALAPVHQTFADAEAVIYACAAYKPRSPGLKSLRAFIDDDHATFRRDDPTLRLDRLPDLVTGGGAELTLYQLTPGSGANWEVIAYGEEAGEKGSTPDEGFFLTFVLSARSQAARDAAQPAFRRMLQAYR